MSGKKRTVSAGTKTAAEERRKTKLAELLDTASRDGRLGDEPTIADLGAWWLSNVASTSVRATTLHSYRKNVDRIGRYLGDVLLRELDTETVRTFVADLLRDGLAETTRRNTRTTLRQMAETAVELGYLPNNPVTRVPNPKDPAEVRKARLTLTPEETRKLVKALDGSRPLDAAIGLLFTSGMRVSEALGLAWSDVDLDAGTARIVRAATYSGGGVGLRLDEPKTKRTSGIVHLSPSVVALLRSRKTEQAKDRLASGAWETIEYEGEPVALVFTNKVGGIVARQYVTKALNAACKRAGIDPTGVGTHTGRRSVATALFVAGLPVDDVARHVGHADPATTAKYVQSLGDRPRDTARRAAELLDPVADE